MLENVQQATIRPLVTQCVAPGTRVYTDEYDIYHRLPEWGFDHHAVPCHGRGEYARDDDGDGFHEVHVNTAEGFWSLLRSWLRPHRGISQEKLPLCTWVSFSSCITRVFGAKACTRPFGSYWWRNQANCPESTLSLTLITHRSRSTGSDNRSPRLLAVMGMTTMSIVGTAIRCSFKWTHRSRSAG